MSWSESRISKSRGRRPRFNGYSNDDILIVLELLQELFTAS